MTFAIGENVGAYRITDRLGQGGMATVYRAYHAKLNRYVAIKVLHPAFKEDVDFLIRFQREAQIVARLEHPNIVPVYDYSEHNGQPYLVMKFIEGVTLKTRVSDKPLTIQDVVQIMTAVGYALTYAHNRGILHRDIKPSNILLEQSNDHPYLADFGLARIAGAGESTMSQDMMLGTPQYISPEQAQGVRDLDASTDIYSLGVVMYEVLVGRVPFNADTPYAIVHDHIYSPLPLPSKINPQIPLVVEQVLLKGLAKDRADRYQSAAEMVDAFREAVEASGMVAANFAVGRYRVGPVPGPLAKAVNNAPSTLSTPTNLSGVAITGPATEAVTPRLPPMPSTATALLPDRRSSSPVTPSAVGVPAVLPSSVAAAATMTLPESLTELRRRKHRRRQQAQLWTLGGFAGLVITVLAGLLITVATLNDPSLRRSQFALAAGLSQPSPRPDQPAPATLTALRHTAAADTTPAVTALQVSATDNAAASSSTTPVKLSTPLTPSLNVTTPTEAVIPDLTIEEATSLTKQDAQNPVNWFALAMAAGKTRRLQTPTSRLQNAAFETGLTLAADDRSILVGAAKAFATAKMVDYASVLFAKILTISGANSDDRSLAQHYFYLIATAHDSASGSVPLFNRLLVDYPKLIDMFAFASIANSTANNLIAADDLLGKAVNINPSSWEIHLARGMLESAANQPDLAIGEFRASLGAPGWAVQEMTNLTNQAAATLTATVTQTAAARSVPSP